MQKLLLMLRRALLMQLGTSRIASFYFVVVFVLVARMLCVFVYYCYVPHAGFAPFYYDYLHLRNGLK